MSKEVSENKSVLPKKISFRPTKAIDEAIKDLMKTHKINKTQAIEHIFREWQILTQQSPDFTNGKKSPAAKVAESNPLDEPYPPCDFRIFNTRTNLNECINTKPPVNLKHFSKFGLLPKICNVCKSVKIVQKATDSTLKTVKKPKLEYIYCEAEGLKIPIDLNQAKCRKCSLMNFNKWSECQRKHKEMEAKCLEE